MRLRFAPSPTGYLHVGGARTALYNWLLARRHGGVFVLRMEDTDQSRSTEEAIEAMLDDMAWLGLDWDEGPRVGGAHGPYRQTERAASYEQAARRLLDEGKAFRCFCTPEETEELRRAAGDAGAIRERHRCRHLTPDEVATRLESRLASAVRFAVRQGSTVVHDMVRGDVAFDNANIEDFVLLRRDGTATYNLAVVLDDLAMAITDVVRGDDHLPNTPKQILLYEALGAEVPRFAHLPMIVGDDGRPLSKRFADVSIESYRDQGYLPEAIVNFLALLGWSLDDKTTVMDRETLIANFSLDRVGAKPGVWDRDKLNWLNGTYIRTHGERELAVLLQPVLAAAGLELDPETVVKAVPLVKERMQVLSDALPLLRFLAREVETAPEAKEVLATEDARRMLQASLARLEALPPDGWKEEAIEALLREVGVELGLKPKVAFQPVRVAVTGSKVSPPLFASLELLGRDRTLERMRAALNP